MWSFGGRRARLLHVYYTCSQETWSKPSLYLCLIRELGRLTQGLICEAGLTPQSAAGGSTESGGSFSALGLLLSSENLGLSSWGEIPIR